MQRLQQSSIRLPRTCSLYPSDARALNEIRVAQGIGNASDTIRFLVDQVILGRILPRPGTFLGPPRVSGVRERHLLVSLSLSRSDLEKVRLVQVLADLENISETLRLLIRCGKDIRGQ